MVLDVSKNHKRLYIDKGPKIDLYVYFQPHSSCYERRRRVSSFVWGAQNSINFESE